MRILYSAVITIMLLEVIPLAAATINVPGDFPTIQQGIDASSDGDTVLVQPGTYTENINFNGHNIVVGSLFLSTQDTSYISITIIDGNQSGAVVTFVNGEHNPARITGFTIRNGYSLSGGGIYCDDGSDPTISHNLITSNNAGQGDAGAGAGICIYDCSPAVDRNTISGNIVQAWTGAGAGIFCLNSSATITNNIIEQNSVLAGGGAFGGGIYADSNCQIQYNRIDSNAAEGGGGIFSSGGNISYNLIINNERTGIYYQGACYISNNTIIYNGWGVDPGDGIYCSYDCGSSTIMNSIIRDNGVAEIEIYSPYPEVIYNDIRGGWEGEGNIDCDPLFCGPANGDFHLHISSCCVGAGQDGGDIGAFGVGCGIPCDGYVIGDYNGSGVFNVADVVDGYSRLKTGQPIAAMICECPPGSGIEWAVAMDVNGSCTFNVADIVKAVYKLLGSPDELIPCEYCPPER